MDIFNVISLLGGLALFLYGMSIMGNGLERVSGGKLEKALEKITSNVFMGVLFGALVTAMIQSSSATTVIVVGFVNAGILKLRQAIGVIMGANIGTTITAHILRLTDIDSSNIFLKLLKPTTLAPIFALIGIIMFMISKRSKYKELGQILLGFSILFSGLFAMEGSVAPLKDSPAFGELFAMFSNPVLGVLVGALVTAIIQSSSASVGILQALSSTGAITFASAFPIIMGQNIGTCVTPLISSIGANKNAKRAAMVHLYFNIIGTIIFLILIYSGAYALKYFGVFDFWSPDLIIDKGVIANFHTIFNIFTTLLFLPFTGLLEKLANMTIKNGDSKDSINDVSVLDERFLSSPSVAVNQVRSTVVQMGKYAHSNFKEAATLFDKYDTKTVDRIYEMENAIDKMEDKLGDYLLKISDRDLSDAENKAVSQLLHLINEFERIGDYSINVVEKAKRLYDSGAKFSEKAQYELNIIISAVDEIISLSMDCFVKNDTKAAVFVEPLEETIDQMEEYLKDKHIDRLRTGKCSVDAGIVFLELLTDIERIADHCSNIAIYVIEFAGRPDNFDRHDYLRMLHEGNVADYKEKYTYYENKYFERIKAR